MLPGGAENQRPSVLASLRTAETLKPLLARNARSHVAPLPLRAGEGPNGWGENRGRLESQDNVFASTVRRSATSTSLRIPTLARVSAELLRRGARCAPRCRRGVGIVRARVMLNSYMGFWGSLLVARDGSVTSTSPDHLSFCRSKCLQGADSGALSTRITTSSLAFPSVTAGTGT